MPTARRKTTSGSSLAPRMWRPMGAPHSMFVLALGSLGCVGVGLSEECVTTFKPDVVSLAVSFVSVVSMVPVFVFARAAPLGADAGPCMCGGGARFVALRDGGVVVLGGALSSSILALLGTSTVTYEMYPSRNLVGSYVGAEQVRLRNRGKVASEKWQKRRSNLRACVRTAGQVILGHPKESAPLEFYTQVKATS